MGRRGLEEVRAKLTRAQTMGPGDFMQSKQNLPKGTPVFDLGLIYSECTDILGKTEDAGEGELKITL